MRQTPLQRRRLYRPPARRDEDKVTPETALAVFKRDAGCMAPRLGGTAMDCFGRNGLEHVKEQPRMGVRAEPLMQRLITLCDGHREPGMRAGYQWNTDAANRERCRQYLREKHPDA